MSQYRPRGLIARTIFEKYHNDQYLDSYDTKLWYSLNEPPPKKFESKFVPLEKSDIETENWLQKAKSLSADMWLQIWHSIAKLFLSIFMTQTDINGYLKRGSMFILSENQFHVLLKEADFNIKHFQHRRVIDMLDIGAGDGEITLTLAKSIIKMQENLNLRIYVTETSWTMRERLAKKKFLVVDKIRDVSNIPLITCLNVLDRCIDPQQILKDIYDILAPNGKVVIALVLPYIHYVEFNETHLPITPLLSHWPEKAKQYSFVTEAVLFFEMLEFNGFKIDAWTKAPYLCEGDLRQSFYWLNDLIVVVSKN